MDNQSPDANQFDFWVGEWNLTWGDRIHGKNSVRKILDGHVIEENFDGTPAIPLIGRSVSVFSAQYARWHQTWVDNQGSYLDFVGEWYEDDQRMILERDDYQGGRYVKQRMVFYEIKSDSLEWSWERSEDGGITWERQWQIHYERAK
jgi:hypothetical protein